MSKDFVAISHESTLRFASESIRALTLVNGGAVLALLTFCGDIATSQTSRPVIDIPKVADALPLFAAGLAIGVAVGFCAYLAQAFFTHFRNRIGLALQVLGGLAAAASLGCFVRGVWIVAEGFNTTASPPAREEKLSCEAATAFIRAQADRGAGTTASNPNTKSEAVRIGGGWVVLPNCNL